MQRLRTSQLKDGQVFDQAVFNLGGQKLLNAGVPLSATHLEAIRRCGNVEVVLARGIEELEAAGLLNRVDSAGLSVGSVSGRSLVGGGGAVVLEQGERVEEHHLDAIKVGGGAFTPRKGITGEELRRERMMLSDHLVLDLEKASDRLRYRIPPDPSPLPPAIDTPPRWPALPELVSIRDGHVETLRKAFAKIEAGVTVGMETFVPILDDLSQRLRTHPSRFTQLALLCPRREDYLPDHAFTCAVLSMAIASQLRWPAENVREVGQAALLFDLGMLLIPERIRTSTEELTDIDRARIRKHPLFSLAMMQAVKTVPDMIRLAAYQHHERDNGMGYPKSLRKEAVSDYARVLAVADTFAATTEPRNYRQQKLPYNAMEEMLRSTAALVFWKPAAKAMVLAAGLFPVGSYVKLTDGRSARVVSSNTTQPDRPIVQPISESAQHDGAELDLQQASKTAGILRPIPAPEDASAAA